MDICHKNIERWIQLGTKRRYARRPKRNQELEYCLHDWVMGEVRTRRRMLTVNEVRRKALDMSDDCSFKASIGWIR